MEYKYVTYVKLIGSDVIGEVYGNNSIEILSEIFKKYGHKNIESIDMRRTDLYKRYESYSDVKKR